MGKTGGTLQLVLGACDAWRRSGSCHRSIGAALVVLSRSVKDNGFILVSLVRNEILTRYTNTMLVVLWSLINPLVMILIYSFVFAVIFQVRFDRLEGAADMPYGIILFSGLLLLIFLAEPPCARKR